MKRILFWIAAGMILSATAATAQAPAQGAAASGDARRGQNFYVAYSCYACHGYNGQTGNGTRLVPMIRTVESFTTFIRNPRTMPPYSAKVLPDSQAADLFAYIKTLPAAPEARNIPLLDQILSEK